MNFNNLLSRILGTVRKGSQSVSNSPLNSSIGGVLAAGLVSMLAKKKNTQELVKAGSIVALGYIIYEGYQSQQQGRNRPELPQQAFGPVGQLAEIHSHVILRTMIAVAASDGPIDEAEEQVIARKSGIDAETAAWLAAEYEKPATVRELAAAVGNDEASATEIYLAARLVCTDLSRKEIIFLTRLSQALGLDDQLVENLEEQPDLT